MTTQQQPSRPNVWAFVAAVTALLVAVAALSQAYLTSRHVEALEHQTMIAHYTASVELLESGEMAVRIGAVQALAHLAETQPEHFHLRVMRLLSAFIREPPAGNSKPRRLRADVQSAVDAIIYRSAEGRRIEEAHRARYAARHQGGPGPISGAIIDLTGSNLQWANLYRAELANAVLDHANLSHAWGNAAVFTGASLVGVVAHNSGFISANFDLSNMLGADWSESVLQNSRFVGASMPSVLRGAHLERANLSSAVFGAVDLTGASMEHANLSGTTFGPDTRVVVYREGVPSTTRVFPVLTQEQLDAALADPSNPPVLPDGLNDARDGQPVSWKTETRGRAWSAYRERLKQAGVRDHEW